ncbi:hypothetical protein HDV00_003578 [Rhizophlyctis rosea]|nr:hypothetical protein HDV00_003578 [Rhizophlyctis rosea]
MSETASFYAVYNSTKEGVTPNAVKQDPLTAHADEIKIKQSWWQSILFNAVGRKTDNTHDDVLWRNFKMAIWFEEVKVEQSYWDLAQYTERDYHITYDTEGVTKAFLEDVSSDVLKFPVAWAGRMQWDCSGQLTLNKDYNP